MAPQKNVAWWGACPSRGISANSLKQNSLHPLDKLQKWRPYGHTTDLRSFSHRWNSKIFGFQGGVKDTSAFGFMYMYTSVV